MQAAGRINTSSLIARELAEGRLHSAVSLLRPDTASDAQPNPEAKQLCEAVPRFVRISIGDADAYLLFTDVNQERTDLEED